MNRCPNCGNKLSDIDVLCPKCGTFVEVVQSPNDSTAPTAQPSSEDVNSSSETDELRPDIILYNEDLPPDGMPSDDDIDIPETFTQIFHEPAGDTLYTDDDVMPDDNEQPDENLEPEDDVVQGIESLLPEDDTDQQIAGNDTDESSQDVISTLGDAAYDESVYSESYLDMLKNMPLPEVDDLSDFDPDAFIQSYRETKDVTPLINDQNEDSVQESDLRRWLELEEVDSLPAEPYTEADTISEDTGVVPAYAETETLTDETESDMPSDDDETSADMTDIYALSANNDSDLRRSNFLSKTHEKKPRRKTITFMIVLAWIALAAVLLFGFVIFDNYVEDTYGSYSSMFDKITNGRIILDTAISYQRNAAVTVTQTQTEDGQGAHLFHIDAPAGQTVTLQPLDETFPLTGGKAQLIIADDLLFSSLDAHTEEATYTTDAISFLIQTDKASYSFPADALTLSLNPTHYVRSQPEQSFLSTTDSTIAVSITVAPQTSVTINGVNHTGDLGTDGVLALKLDLTLGDNTFDIAAEQPGKAVTTDSFTITRQTAQTKLVPVTDYLRIYNDSFTTIGETIPNAEVLALVDNKGAYSALVNDDGSYTLSCSVEGYGLHDIRLTADSAPLEKSSTNMRVEYIPDIDTFTLEAQTLSLRSAARSSNGTLIHISGTLSELQSDDTTQFFTLIDGGSSLPCYYYGTSLLEADKEYTIYGIYDDAQSAFYAMYVV